MRHKPSEWGVSRPVYNIAIYFDMPIDIAYYIADELVHNRRYNYRDDAIRAWVDSNPDTNVGILTVASAEIYDALIAIWGEFK